jgi:hypothetical protein
MAEDHWITHAAQRINRQDNPILKPYLAYKNSIRQTLGEILPPGDPLLRDPLVGIPNRAPSPRPMAWQQIHGLSQPRQEELSRDVTPETTQQDDGPSGSEDPNANYHRTFLFSGPELTDGTSSDVDSDDSETLVSSLDLSQELDDLDLGQSDGEQTIFSCLSLLTNMIKGYTSDQPEHNVPATPVNTESTPSSPRMNRGTSEGPTEENVAMAVRLAFPTPLEISTDEPAEPAGASSGQSSTGLRASHAYFFCHSTGATYPSLKATISTASSSTQTTGNPENAQEATQNSDTMTGNKSSEERQGCHEHDPEVLYMTNLSRGNSPSQSLSRDEAESSSEATKKPKLSDVTDANKNNSRNISPPADNDDDWHSVETEDDLSTD